MSGQAIRFGLVGAGAIAQSYLEAFRTLSEGTSYEARLVGVADVRPDAAAALAEGAGCAAYDSHQALADEADCQAVIVCTPPVTHAPICLDLLARRIPVLCEKPLALDAASARKMVAAAEQNGVLFTMASKFRYADDVVRARSILESGILGDIILFENVFTSRVDMAGRWNADPSVSGGGVLIDNGTHSVDLVRYFLGPVAEVHAVEGKRIQDLPVEDTARIFVRSESDVMCSIDLSWSLHKEVDSYIDIYGSHGAVRVGWAESKYRQAGSADWVVFGSGYDKVAAFRNEIRNFAAALRGEETLRISAADAIASVEVIEAAYESLARSRWMPVAGGPAAVPNLARA